MSELPFPQERTGYPAPESLIARRAAMLVALGTFPEAACRLDGGRWGTVRALRFNPAGAANGTVLHWHGGGFRLGCPEYAAPFAMALAVECDVEVICPEYRLAPEYPFPTGLRDGTGAIEGALALGATRIIISGDSAGGGLAAGVAIICADLGIALAGAVLLSPWLDLTVTSPWFAENAATDPLFSHEAAREGAAQYLQGRAAGDPLASPLFADVQAFPATYQSVGAGEVLVGDARAFHEKLVRAGRSARLSVIPGMEHVAVMRGKDLIGSAQVFTEVADFVRECLQQSK